MKNHTSKVKRALKIFIKIFLPPYLNNSINTFHVAEKKPAIARKALEMRD